MGKFTSIKAKAKINIALDIVGKRDDGYHEIKTIMQTVDLCDNVKITVNKESDGINITTDSDKIPTDEKNLAYKAASYLKENYGIKDGIDIYIQKNIPVAAGLAGGSTDCAAVLKGVRNLFELPLSDSELKEIAVKFGADVPYCIDGGTCLAEGIGEKLTKLPDFPVMYVVLAKPDIDVSSAEVYKEFDMANVSERPDMAKFRKDIEKNNLKEVCDSLCNVLESVTIKKYPIIEEIKGAMLEFGALGSLMSGSGPTVFGLYIYKQDGINTLKYLRSKFGISECYLVNIANL